VVREEDICKVDESRAKSFGDLLGEVEVGMERGQLDGLND
jgi:hypothetical protein